MTALARGQANSTTLPVLVLHAIFDHVLKDAELAEFAVWYQGTQVFPVSGRESIDVDSDRIGLGSYAAPYQVPTNEGLGKHEIRWWYRETATSDPVEYTQVFEVVEAVSDARAPAYAFLADLRDLCILQKDADDARLQGIVALASRYVERATGRFFEPRYRDIRISGRDTPTIRLMDPIIAIGSVAIDYGPLSDTEVSIALEDLLVYNRHLAENLNQPDDRNAPRLELFRLPTHARTYATGVTFPPGQQNIHIQGVFGFTDPDGTPVGDTPQLIARVTQLLALRYLPKLSDVLRREAAEQRWRLLEERGGQGSYKLASLPGNPAFAGRFTGDPEIDQILASYSRPPRIEAV